MLVERTGSHRLLVGALLAVAALRLLTIGLYTLADTTEARYAEVARKMVELNNWITPWYDYGVPFWAKPPLSTWLTAGSFMVLGVNEFAARLPHFLMACLVAWLVWDWLRQRSMREAFLAVIMLAASLLFFVSAGAVMTDMALALGTTMALRGFWLGMWGAPAQRTLESTLAFVGLGVGLLAKGPVALVLTLLPLAGWALLTRNVGQAWRRLPWYRGSLLTVALALPWYVLADQATPGFLQYFLVGEHWQRFVTPGWAGDRYGNAHQFARGTVWAFMLAAALPWTVLVPLLRVGRRVADAADGTLLPRQLALYLLAWALAPCLFFTLARNIIWTYVLPALPAAAIASAIWLHADLRRPLIDRWVTGAALAAALVVSAVLLQREWSGTWNTGREMVLAYEQQHRRDVPLVFVGRRPYSVSFYSSGRAAMVKDWAQLQAARRPVFAAVAAEQLERAPALGHQLQGWVLIGIYGRYALLYGPSEARADPS